ncbi:hypothetical protein U1Q18_045044 [Sarracenia purpurea var. burkii]
MGPLGPTLVVEAQTSIIPVAVVEPDDDEEDEENNDNDGDDKEEEESDGDILVESSDTKPDYGLVELAIISTTVPIPISTQS